jgi:anti-sigma regulatory factor (Ser/Thr protein kinase)
MRTGAPAAHHGYFHQAAIYDSDHERHDIIEAHIVGAIDAGEPVLVALPPEETELLSALGDVPNVTLLPALSSSSRPAATIKTLTGLLTPLVAQGHEQIRAVQSVPHPGIGSRWAGWCRYEAAINDLLADIPVWGLCLYDARTAPIDVLSDVERTHPHFLTADGSQPNPRYVQPVAFLQSRNLSRPDPLEHTPANLQLINPAPAHSRRAVRDWARHTDLSADDIDQLILATSEAVTNAILHGQPPVVLKIWTVLQRMVITVSDQGSGPTDPYVGLIPPHTTLDGGGLGLWIIHQLVDVNFGPTDHGFTLRLTAEPAPV